MPQKHPTWTRSRVGRDRVHWVAYDDRAEAEDRRIVDQGYAPSLAAADAAARAALAGAGMYQARRTSTSFGASPRVDRDKPEEKARRPERPIPREYLYTRRLDDEDDGRMIAAHLIVKKTARRVYVTRRSIGPDQVGTEDEAWGLDEPTTPLDRAALERDGSVFSKGHRHSDFYATREAATGDAVDLGRPALKMLGLRAPCTVGDIKAAYRRRAMEVHPDRGGDPGEFQAVEAAYRRLLREAQAPGP